jgi:hypothetical protein
MAHVKITFNDIYHDVFLPTALNARKQFYTQAHAVSFDSTLSADRVWFQAQNRRNLASFTGLLKPLSLRVTHFGIQGICTRC